MTYGFHTHTQRGGEREGGERKSVGMQEQSLALDKVSSYMAKDPLMKTNMEPEDAQGTIPNIVRQNGSKGRNFD